MAPWLTSIISILGSIFVAFITAIITTRIAYRHQKRKERNETVDRLKSVFNTMPDLIKGMHADFSDIKNESVRRMVILPNSKITYKSLSPFFQYGIDEFQNLNGYVDVLINNGFISETTDGDIRTFRIDEEFFEAVRDWNKKDGN